MLLSSVACNESLGTVIIPCLLRMLPYGIMGYFTENVKFLMEMSILIRFNYLQKTKHITNLSQNKSLMWQIIVVTYTFQKTYVLNMRETRQVPVMFKQSMSLCVEVNPLKEFLFMPARPEYRNPIFTLSWTQR